MLAMVIGVSATCKHFSKKFRLRESTVRSIRDSYIEEHRKRQRDCDDGAFPEKKRGRSVLLGDTIDTKILKESARRGWGCICQNCHGSC